MDGSFSGNTAAIISDPVELVKHHLGAAAVMQAVQMTHCCDDVVAIDFTAGRIYVRCDLSQQTIEVFLPRWAWDLGWRVES